MPDQIAYTDKEIKSEKEDDIAKASSSDIFAYSNALVVGEGSVQNTLTALEPKALKAEEDTGSMALFI